jgi:hypothetical protein
MPAECMILRHRVNVTWGPKEERLLITGVHTVADIYCTSCNTVLGWKYVRQMAFDVLQGFAQPPAPSPAHCQRALYHCCAHTQEHAVEEREKYKEGKSIVEKAKVMKARLLQWQHAL